MRFVNVKAIMTEVDTKYNRNSAPHLVHTHDVHLDDDYTRWLVELKTRYRSAQITAAVKVNAEKLLFNWQLGRDLVIKKAEERWGAGVVEQVSLDLHAEFPHDKGFSTRNLWYMKQWYEFYTREPQFLQRVVAEIQIPELRLQQAVAEIPAAFACIPWGQHIEIFTQCETIDEAIFYMRETIQKSLTRPNLSNIIRSGLYHHRNKALTNFSTRLPIEKISGGAGVQVAY